MAGDKSCVKARALSDTRIMCADKDGQELGYRDAMTSDQMTMWMHQQTIAAMQSAATQQGIRDNNAAIAQIGQQMTQQSYGYSVTQPSQNTGGVTYRQVGTSLIGSNGVSYQYVGNTLIGSDGTRCQVVGSTIICN